MPLIADRAFAARIERSVTRDLAIYARTCRRLDPHLSNAHLDFAGGTALFLAPGSPVNMVYGAGFEGPVSPSEFDSVERFYAERGTRAAISLSPLADRSLIAQLGARGWMIADFEDVLVQELLQGAVPTGFERNDARPEVSVRVARDAADRAIWAVVSSGAFTAPEPPDAEVTRLGEAMAARDDVTLLVAVVDGEDAGTGALWIDDHMGWLLGDATLPQYRRRGAQSALVAHRTRLAAEAGCEFAVTEARPGSVSHRTMERAGYRVVYTRVELIAPPPR